MSEEMVTIGRRYSIVIPKCLRESLDLRVGDKLSMRVIGDRLVMRGLPRDPFETLERIIGESYDKSREEKRVEEGL